VFIWWVRRKLAQPVARLAWDARLLLPLSSATS
jgi:hypothetical protein